MIPIKHPLCNDILKRPATMTEEECADLHIVRNQNSVISFWSPSPEEREAIATGQPIIFEAVGVTHPPIKIDVLAAEIKPAPVEVSDRIREIADSYIRQCFPGVVPPRQAIELKLAIYGGMMAMLRELCSITDRNANNAEECAAEVEDVRNALMERASYLNQARAGL